MARWSIRPAATIPTEKCWELLRNGWFGRLGLSVDALPAILPVEYSVAEGDLVVCLGHYRLSARSLDNSVVAFAADLIDRETHSGWRRSSPRPGPATHASVTTECGQHEPGQIIFITPQTLRGETFNLCPFGTGLPRLDAHLGPPAPCQFGCYGRRRAPDPGFATAHSYVSDACFGSAFQASDLLGPSASFVS